MIVANNSAVRFLALSLLCVAAAFLNYLSNFLVFSVFGVPLFVNTIFSAAVTFYAGLIPGLATILINRVFRLILYGSISLFVIISVVEVIVIWLLKPACSPAWPSVHGRRAFAETVSIFAKLMLLYITTALTASVLGGLIDYYTFTIMGHHRGFFSVEDVFKGGFYGSEFHQLAIDILARFPINLIDRAIVVFGGYFIALGLRHAESRLSGLPQR